MKKTVALLLTCEILSHNALVLASSPTIPGYYGKVTAPAATTLPVYESNPGGGATVSQSGNQMTVTQNQGNANVVIDWSSFNIGSASSVRFYQGTGTPGTSTWTPNTSYAALNRIYDANPSLIFGALKADGQVYLINRNGILFGSNSQVNVYGLIASALNITTQNFNKGLLSFTTTPDTNSDSNQSGTIGSDVTVANMGTITTANGGFVALVGPQVENDGTITSPIGKIALIGVADAGQNQTDVQFTPNNTTATSTGVVDYNPAALPGIATNSVTGSLIADQGRVEMDGASVNQNGLVRAISSVKIAGAVYLLATDTITTGPGSVTSAPVTDSQDKVSQTFSYNGGSVTLEGIYSSAGGGALPLQNIVNNGAIDAPSGTITLNAVNRVYLETGSSLNVAGLWVNEPASAELVGAQLNSVQLADSYTQKSGTLQGQTITTTLLAGTSVGDITATYTLADMTAQERSTAGGNIIIGGVGSSLSSKAITGPTADAEGYVLKQFIAKQGATIDFSGGGYLYAAGSGVTTTVVSGNSVYNIANAPQNLTYQAILSDQQFTNAKFGITTSYSGVYTGSGTPLMEYLPARTVGSNAGLLSVQAKTVVLDGTLNGSVTRGQYQTATTDPSADSGNDYAVSVARGLEEPVGGTVVIGYDPGSESSSNATTTFVTNSIAVQATTTPLPASFTSTSQLGSLQTDLSAAILNNAGLSRLSLLANTTLTIASGASISLLPSGSYTNTSGTTYLGGFTGKARVIAVQGEIDAPDGSVSLTLQDNASAQNTNALYTPLTNSILIDSGSRISVAGETVDNSLAGLTSGNPVKFGQINGGAISIQDMTIQGTESGNSVVVRSGAVLDVSGGYSIGSNGAVTGGNAGSLTLAGATLSVAGDLRGFSLPGTTGGAITLHAGEVDVTTYSESLPDNLPVDGAVPAQLLGKLILDQDQLASTGFTRITLEAMKDVNFESGVTLTPSTVKSAMPVPASEQYGSGSGLSGDTAYPAGYTQTTDYVGSTSVTVQAGQKIYTGTDANTNTIYYDNYQGSGQISLPSGTAVKVIPGGSISLGGTNSFNESPTITMAGTLEALGGNVNVTAGSLTIGTGGEILAGGYNKPGTTMVAGLPAGPTPEPGGSVTLNSNAGITLEAGSLIDVSGSTPTQVITADVNGNPLPVTAAGSAGSLTLNYAGALSLGGEIDGHARLAGVQGGTLTVNNSYNSNSSPLNVTATDFRNYLNSGFDAITLRSYNSLNFQGDMDVTVGRSLTLDAPLMTGVNSDAITLSSPWITLTNTSPNVSPSGTAGNAQLSLSGDWLNITGSTVLSGFSNVNMKFSQDITLNYTYNATSTDFLGQLSTAGNLTMQAARIYPATSTTVYSITSTNGVSTNSATPTDFTITSGGVFTMLPGETGNSNPVYSAGGSITINAAKGIDIEGGVLAAPLGTIDLESSGGRVYLGSGSVLTTGADSTIPYGYYDGTGWYVPVMSASGSSSTLITQQVTSAPGKSITINGNEVVVQPGAKLDVSGGGTVFAYSYQADTEGTTDPISTVGISELTLLQTRSNRYVIVPDNSVQIPGFTYTDANGKTQTAGAVYLSAMKLDNGTTLKAGYYSLLPEQYAYLPGALIISDTGSRVAQGSSQRTSDGYQIDAGYSTFLGTGITSNVFEGYEIQSAANVLKQGNFTVVSSTAGNAGNLTISGTSTVLAGTINATPLPGYATGILSLSGSSITVQDSVTALPAGFDFTTPLPAALSDQLQLSAATLTNSGFGTLNLGDSSTKTIDVRSGSILNLPNITFSAANTITVEDGAQVTSSSSGGTVSLLVPLLNSDGSVNKQGTVDIRDGAKVYAAGTVALTANIVNLDGSLSVATHGTMDLTSSEIFFVSDSYVKSGVGLYLTEKIWDSFANYDQVTLTSSSDLNFKTNVNLTAGNTLTLDTGKLITTGAASVALNAANIILQNSGSANPLSSSKTIAGSSLTLNAGNTLQATGSVAFDGFDTVNLYSLNDMTLKGTGSLTTNGNLNLTAARVTTSYYLDASGVYNAADFAISAAGAVNIMNSNGTAGTTATPGGSLAITGSSITQSGIIEVASGQVQMTATSGDITLSQNAQILAPGSKQQTAGTATTGEYSYSPGGEIYLSSANGNINLASGSVLDVSAAAQGDAGAISLAAPTGTVTLAGTLKGSSTTGAGGSFTLDANAFSLDLDHLSSMLYNSGFTNQLTIRARQGDLTLDQNYTLTAQDIVLEADGTDSVLGNTTGNITINGTINALSDSSGNGGQVDLYAQNNLTVNGTISANASQGSNSSATGGYVYLNSQGSNGLLTIGQNAVINVSGGPDSGTGGTVYLRAQQNTNGPNGAGVNMNLAGTINGASSVVAEAFRVYNSQIINSITTPSPFTQAGIIDSNAFAYMDSDATKYMGKMGSAATIAANLLPASWDSSIFHFRPGIDVQSSGDLTLSSSIKLGTTSSSTLNLTNYRYNDEPGVLTLQAAGNLNINANLVDHPTASYTTLYSTTMQNSWGFNLTAGADLNAANPLAVQTGLSTTTGNLNIAPISPTKNIVVYTEDAPINFASANNTNISTGAANSYMINNTMLYSLASYGGDIRGTVGNDLYLNDGGVIQTATGNISITIGGDLDLYDKTNQVLGAIRTTGEYAKGTYVTQGLGSTGTPIPTVIGDYWTYENGGSIYLNVAGSVVGNVNNNSTGNTSGDNGLTNAWDYTYGGSTGSLNTLNKYLAASFQGANSSEGIITMGGGNIAVRAGGAFTCQTGAFGAETSGNLDIVAGGNILGRFRVMNGTASLISGGNFGDSDDHQVIEMANAQVSVAAQGDVYLGTVLNPDNTRSNLFYDAGAGNPVWNLTYGENSSVSIASLAGSLSYYGNAGLTGSTYFDGYNPVSKTNAAPGRQDILPPVANFIAAGDINLTGNNNGSLNLILAPSPTGNITLFAGGSIDGTLSNDSSTFAEISMSDQTPSSYYGYQTAQPSSGSNLIPLHQGDTNPVQIIAGQDIRNMQFTLTKEADISAGRDISQIVYNGQNIAPTDVSSISAGRDINYAYTTASASDLPNLTYGITQSGPGLLVVQAGQNINLGNSAGIQSVGNFSNTSLPSTGCDVIVAVGAKNNQLSLADTQAFFTGLQQAGIEYSDLLAEGDTAAAEQVITQARATFVSKLFNAPPIDGSGDINMTQSQISTVDGKSNLYIMAQGSINVGTTSLANSSSATSTGIFTAEGGAINMYSGGDVNVNESRVLTYLGGDITIWSDDGSINAGRGSKTTISATPPKLVDGVVIFTPPAVGSGVRALTYDPNTVPGGPLPIPSPGNIYLFAPQGVIDAGEAGIAGGKVILGATQVLNSQNISFSSGSVGVPSSSEAGISIGSLAGAGSVAESTKMIAESSSLGGAKDKLNQQPNLVDQFMSNFLDIKVINFDTDEGTSDNGNQDEKEKKKK
jgi:filamentous hemagglutinin family protein